LTPLAILGGGSWGTALSIVLAPRFERIQLWVHEPSLATRIEAERENAVFLPGFLIPPNIHATADLALALRAASTVILVTPSHHLRSVLVQAAEHLQGPVDFVSATKGIEAASLLRMSQVIHEVLGPKSNSPATNSNVAVLSGPTFAREIAAGEPAAVVIASENHDLATRIQSSFSGPTFRLYTNSDVTGVELGAALKNVIAIAAGICQGLGLGSNAVAALITRGLAEITRLAVAMGAEPQTLAGLAGLGDLVLTCHGQLSRNRHVGIELAKGTPLQAVLASTQMVAEGVQTTFAAADLARKHSVDMPITQQMYEILQLGRSPRDGIRELMDRALKQE
jgi:glycerol-3-phosphate dehydrogenase (NAD(P)+)